MLFIFLPIVVRVENVPRNVDEVLVVDDLVAKYAVAVKRRRGPGLRRLCGQGRNGRRATNRRRGPGRRRFGGQGRQRRRAAKRRRGPGLRRLHERRESSLSIIRANILFMTKSVFNDGDKSLAF